MNAATFRAWSSTVRLVVTNERALTAAAADLVALLDRVDRAASRFRPDSALSKANANAGRPTAVPKLLVELVGAALDAALDSDGAVDPTLGLAMRRIGYDRDIADLGDDRAAGEHSARADHALLGRVGGWRKVRLHREAGLITVPRGTALDLGATAKAWTADYAARTLARRYGGGVLVELGGDLAVAGEADEGWRIRVAEREGADGQLVLIRRGGLTTSTTTVRTWRHGGQPMHHIVDPATGAPADGPWRTVSVAGGSAFSANVAGTAAIVKGERALEWLTQRGTDARLVARDGTVITTGAWPSPPVTTPGFLTTGRSGSTATTTGQESIGGVAA